MKHWIQAARLRTLPLSLSGVITGSFLAVSKGVFRWDICVLALLTTVGFQVLSNFANDYGDGVKGTDNENRVGPQRALQSGAISPKQMLKGIYVTIAITLIIALLLIYVSFGSENFMLSIVFFLLGLASIGAAMKYTMGKGAYGYSGFGDLFVFLFFGLLGVVGCEFLYTQEVSTLSFLPAITIGLFSVGVLNLNNMRDRLSDIQSNKNTMAVKLGANKAKIYHYILLIVGMLSTIYYVVAMGYSFKAYLFLIAFVPLLKHIKTVYTNKEAVLLDPELKKVALSTFLFSLLFGLGLII
ncbi:1,4-dihydroxy-2-naphthoate octaprenyltransferase [Wenyingzhuangia marina]|uniref:1,4-dihydroxy-2-naphthoate octaprenyltransferase n=1 Tax=Wenyingzhuangia marina TaxID=1195760 RepID=A0A1M5WPP9_9FLAO|nr:1,4-dihydroxy-2-naphthoate octaprenyltransferase [Wenyingzhuangia marina]GGF79544.1 1,4-dihydroxy-2-naphthoate octaprenyltransferase [Wenyingzhuangia marina]SHH89114.1 1,4-dihydroxy-2-naphthoate prenyltransferase [Wenyingzhuangia marina]